MQDQNYVYLIQKLKTYVVKMPQYENRNAISDSSVKSRIFPNSFRSNLNKKQSFFNLSYL